MGAEPADTFHQGRVWLCREDLSWLQHVEYLPSIIYQADNASASNKVIRNMGETAAYLQYIVDHYDVLPKQMAFVHGHRKAKHMPDVVPVLQVLPTLECRCYMLYTCNA